VAQEPLNELGVLACHEEYCSAGVAEVVEPHGWQVCSFQEGFEVAAQEIGGARRGARFGVAIGSMPNFSTRCSLPHTSVNWARKGSKLLETSTILMLLLLGAVLWRRHPCAGHPTVLELRV
jgi:hypothetical protein